MLFLYLSLVSITLTHPNFRQIIVPISHSKSIVVRPGVAQWLRHCATSRAFPGSNPGGVGHRDFSRGYRQNHVPWGQLSL